MFRWTLPFAPIIIVVGLLSAAATVNAAGEETGARTIDAEITAGQNRERAALGLSGLRWDPELAVAARGYAAELAATDKWQHSSAETRVGQGENLWMGTRGAFHIDEMVGAWLAERSMFRAGTFPHVSNTGNWEDVGHYTQIIWHGDRRVGCGLSSSAKFDYLVCRYAGPGNVMGEPVVRTQQVAYLDRH